MGTFESMLDENSDSPDEEEDEDEEVIGDLSKLYVILNLTSVQEDGDQYEGPWIYEAESQVDAIKQWNSDNGEDGESITLGVICVDDLERFTISREVKVSRRPK